MGALVFCLRFLHIEYSKGPCSPYTGSAPPTPGSWPPALVCQKVYLIFEPRSALETDLETAKGISMAAVMRGAGRGLEAWQELEEEAVRPALTSKPLIQLKSHA